jgi:hypothetical protein
VPITAVNACSGACLADFETDPLSGIDSRVAMTLRIWRVAMTLGGFTGETANDPSIVSETYLFVSEYLV